MSWSTLYAGCNNALDADGVFDGCLFLSQRRQGAEAQSFFEGNRGDLDGVGFPKGRLMVVRGAVRGRDGTSRGYRACVIGRC